MSTKHSSLKVLLSLSSYTVLLLLLSACHDNDKPHLQPTTLRLSWTTQSQFVGAYLAKEKGLFEREALNVTILPGGPSINEMQIVASGAEDFGIGTPSQLIPDREKGVPVVALAIIFQKSPSVFFAKKSSDIKEPKDFIGKTVGVSYGSGLEYIYRSMMRRAGVDTALIKEYPARFDLTPFLRGDVNVWVGYDTDQTSTAEEQGIEINRIFPDKYGIRMTGDILYTTETMIKNNPERCQRMVDALLDGWQAALRDKNAAVDIVLKLDPKLNRLHEQKMMDAIERLMLTGEGHNKIGWMTAGQWKEMVDLWKDAGAIKDYVDPNKCFDNRFVENHYGIKTEK